MEATGRELRRWLAEQAGTVRGPLALAVVAGGLAGLLTIAQAGVLAWWLTGVLIPERDAPALLPTLGLLLAVVAARAGAGWLREAAGLAAADRVIGGLRRRLYRHLSGLGPVRLAEYTPGHLAGAWLEQLQALEGYYARFLPQTVLAVLVPLMILAVVATQDWLAAALLGLSAPLIPVFMAIIGMGAERISQSQQAAVARAAGHFLDRLRGLTTLRLFGHGEASAAEVEAVADDYRRRTMKTLRVAFLSSAVLEFFAAVAVAVVAIYIGFGLIGAITFGPAARLDLFAGLFILLLAPEFFLPLRQLASHYHDRADGLGAAAELRPLLAGEGAAESVEAGVVDVPARASGGGDGGVVAQELRLEALRIVYPDGRIGLNGVDLTVPAGKRVVVTGPSGSGKSTLLAAVAGFIEPAGGRVAIAGREPPQGPEAQPPVAWMGQRSHLFSRSLRENIRMGRPGADDDAVARVARLAGVDQVAAVLPEGLDTVVGEGGVPLSGGQARRVALARALLKGAPVLLLDEPTTGLDPAGEEALVAVLERVLTAGPTVLLASHHPRLRKLADRVVRLEQGRLQEGYPHG